MNPMLVLLRLVQRSPRYFATCVLFAFLELFWIPIPEGLVSRAFFDSVSVSAIAVLVVLQIAAAWVGPALGNPWNSLQQKSQVVMQRNLFAAVVRGYGRRSLPVSVGEAISRFRDDPRGIADGLDALCDLIARTLFALVALVVMWRIDAILTLVLFVPLLLSAWISETLGTRTMCYRAASQAATSRVTGFLGELLAGQLAVNVAGASPHALARLRELGEGRRRVAVRDSVFGVLLDSFSINLGHLGTGVVLLLGAQSIAAGTFSVGDFALFVLYLDQLVWYPAEIARLISDLKRIEVSFGRMHSLAPEQPTASLVCSSPSGISRPVECQRLQLLEVRGLSYSYPNSTAGVSDVSFTVERGSFTVIMGRVGSGKSTLLQVLLGLLERSGGEICWNGTAVRDPSMFFVPPRSAYVPQVPRLFSETLRDNLLLGGSAEFLDAALHVAALDADVASFERGLDTFVGPRGVKLSGGQVQRAAVARMFLTGAELFVLDDVSSALDQETEDLLWRRLRETKRTCLLVSHRPAALKRADQVLLLQDGRVVS